MKTNRGAHNVVRQERMQRFYCIMKTSHFMVEKMEIGLEDL
jgi:hypothetical protein